MRPGKPLAFGSYRDLPFIGLPGNPVSSFVGFEVFVRPALHKLLGNQGWQRLAVRGTLDDEVKSGGRESYLRAVSSVKQGGLHVKLTGHQGSGNLYSLVQADCLFVVPAGVKHLEPGSDVEIWPL
jgi:molybdopterin molybdotransferase